MSKPSTSGLTKADEAILTQCEEGLAPILSHIHRLGGNEGTKALGLARRIKSRKAPESPSELAADASEF
ncbi:MAG: hypothetical protein ACRD6I_20290, partial [Candidatus Acidiferrales bacterium]